ncbi:glycosyltransferase family 4 protein [Bacteriovoracales bacterium]|nr:glycosyltransferase family 4 protein [Bacteriovoracales bacterium]
MKVLFISADTRSLIQFRRDLMLDLKKRGHEVHAISPNKDQRGDPKILENDGIKIHEISFNRTGMNPFKDFTTFLKMAKVIREVRPELVFSFMIKPVIYGSLAAYLSKVEKIYSLIPGVGHVFLNGSFKGKILRFVVARMYQCALFFNEKVFFQNNDDRKLFISHSILNEKKAFKVNGSGVNMDLFCREKKVLERPVFLLAGRIIAEKGIKEYIEAARKVKKKKGDGVKFLLAGGFDKNPTSYNQKTLNDLNFDDTVEYLGDQKDMKKLYEEASVYVLPSYREGTPRSTLEAMSMKMPVITTDVPGCRETVRENINGHLVSLHSVDELSEKMERFVEDCSLIEKMGQASYKIVEEKFDVKKVNQTYIREMRL